MKTLAPLLFALFALTGCASNDYAAYGKAQSDVAQAKAQADTARYTALAQIAQSGTESSRIAAVMALALGNGAQSQATQIAAPQPSQALQWAQVLAPSLTSIASMHYSSRAAMASAESAARVSESTNATFVGIASKIQAPVTVVPQTITPVLPQANVSTVTTTSTDNHAVTTASNTSSANQANTTTTNANPTTVTLSGTGVVGSGTATTSANPVTTTTTTNPSTVVPAGTVCAVSAAGTLDCKP